MPARLGHASAALIRRLPEDDVPHGVLKRLTGVIQGAISVLMGISLLIIGPPKRTRRSPAARCPPSPLGLLLFLRIRFMANYATENSWVQRLAQASGWILLFAIAASLSCQQSFAPIQLSPTIWSMPESIFSQAVRFGLSYPNRFLAWLVGLSTSTLAIEIAQLWVPGRHRE